MSIRRWIRNWLNSEGSVMNLAVNRSEVPESMQENDVQISIVKAINGRVLTLRSYQPNRRGTIQSKMHSEWVNELYVLKDGESLTEALTMLLITKGLEE